MPFIFDPQNTTSLFAAEYLAGHPERGGALAVESLSLIFHQVHDCLCLGGHSQVFLPVQPGDHLPYLFKDACPYLANEPQLPALAETALTKDATLINLPEAAPFYPPGAENLWHWMCESLPKILALEATGYQGPYIIPRASNVAEESLALLGIAKERLLKAGPSYRVERLIVPPRLSGFSLAENMPLSGFLRQKLLVACGSLKGAKRCYLRRIGTRRVSNEEPLLALLSEFGFAEFTPEEMSLKEQLLFMSNVECSVMPHGAGSTLTLMQKPGSFCIELFGNRYVSYNNLHAVRLLKLRYHALVEDLDISACPRKDLDVHTYLVEGPKADMLVDLTHLRILLENALPAH